MIARALLVFLIFFMVIAGAIWVAFRTHFLNADRTVEIMKCSVIAVVSALIAAFAIGAIVFLEKLS